mgnify:CR=1 FL=1
MNVNSKTTMKTTEMRSLTRLKLKSYAEVNRMYYIVVELVSREDGFRINIQNKKD